MIIYGTPRADRLEEYFMADGDMIWELTKAGFVAKYMDEEVQYFKLNTKLKKFLEKYYEKNGGVSNGIY